MAALSEQQLATLHREHGAALLRLGLHLTNGDHSRAEDLVQETFIRAWQHPEALDGTKDRPWLLTVLRHLAVDAHRARTARPGEVPLLEVDLPPGDGPGQALDGMAVAAAVASLSLPHRQVIVALYFWGFTVAETAAVLGIPPGTVKSRTYYAVRMLRLTLEETPS